MRQEHLEQEVQTVLQDASAVFIYGTCRFGLRRTGSIFGYVSYFAKVSSKNYRRCMSHMNLVLLKY